MATDPLVSVVMAVHNEGPYLRDAVQSILDQTFGDFEFIIVNDGSTDGSKQVLENFAGRDDRIRLVHQDNRGLIASLNRGLYLARGTYIARMDGDDVSHPERFKKQVHCLDTTPEVGVVGTQIQRIDSEGRPNGNWSLPTDPDLIAWKLLFHNYLCHPTVMMRRSLLEDLGGYAEWATHAEDYELWTRVVLQSQLVNLPDPLHKLRRHGDSITATKREEQVRNCAEATANIHGEVLGSSADAGIAHFLAWMEAEGIERAVSETGVMDFAVVHGYLRALYRAYVQRFLSSESNILARRHALPKLDTLANKIGRQRGWLAGISHKLRARLMPPFREFFPWVMKAAKEKMS